MCKLQIKQKVNLLILTNYSFTIYTLIIFQRIQFVNLSLAQSGLFVLTTNWIKYTNKHKQSQVWRGLEDKEGRYHLKKFYVTSSPKLSSARSADTDNTDRIQQYHSESLFVKQLDTTQRVSVKRKLIN